MRTLEIPTAAVFEPLLAPARYKGARGGRGSGKSHFFASKLVEDSLVEPGLTGEGLRSVCIREVQKDLTQSSKLLIEDKIRSFALGEADGFKVFRDVIQTPKDGIIIFKGMQDYTAESVKSLEKFKRAWWEEAQTATQHSLNLLRPTIRDEGSELWFSWNRRFEDDPVELLFREEPKGAIVVEANWRDNPFWNSVLEDERLNWQRARPGEYGHVWEGEFVTVVDGAYYAADMLLAKQQGRISNVAKDPLMPLKAFWDIGIKDATAIWIAQWVGREIRVLDYYEATNQALGTHLEWLRSNGYGSAKCYLPHDGDQRDKITAIRFEDHIGAAGFETEVIANQGKGAYMKRIEASRRVFPSVWFNESTTVHGRKALGWYHAKIDPVRKFDMGEFPDWSNHGADAFGLMCVAYEAPVERRVVKRPVFQPGSWMG